MIHSSLNNNNKNVSQTEYCCEDSYKLGVAKQFELKQNVMMTEAAAAPAEPAAPAPEAEPAPAEAAPPAEETPAA